MFSDIQVLIWDFDGTLYRMSPALSDAVRNAELATIARYTGWDSQRVFAEFTRVHATIPSATATVATICGISTAQAAFETESLFDRRDFTQHDDRLISMFASLSGYTHVVLTNGYSQFVKDTIIRLGLPLETFVEVVTAETVRENKPSLAGFRYIVSKYGHLPEHYLSIGDRPHVDLAPAKAVGMHTCLVWTDVAHEAADVVLHSVYQVPSIVQPSKG